VCIEPMMPPTQSAWAKQKMLYGSMDDLDKDSFPKPFVSKSKARELAGHTNLFGTPPRHSLPSTPVPVRASHSAQTTVDFFLAQDSPYASVVRTV